MKKLKTKSQLASSGRGNHTAPTFPLRKMVGDYLLPVKWDLLKTRMIEVCSFLPHFAKCILVTIVLCLMQAKDVLKGYMQEKIEFLCRLALDVIQEGLLRARLKYNIKCRCQIIIFKQASRFSCLKPSMRSWQSSLKISWIPSSYPSTSWIGPWTWTSWIPWLKAH